MPEFKGPHATAKRLAYIHRLKEENNGIVPDPRKHGNWKAPNPIMNLSSYGAFLHLADKEDLRHAAKDITEGRLDMTNLHVRTCLSLLVQGFVNTDQPGNFSHIPVAPFVFDHRHRQEQLTADRFKALPRPTSISGEAAERSARAIRAAETQRNAESGDRSVDRDDEEPAEPHFDGAQEAPDVYDVTEMDEDDQEGLSPAHPHAFQVTTYRQASQTCALTPPAVYIPSPSATLRPAVTPGHASTIRKNRHSRYPTPTNARGRSKGSKRRRSSRGGAPSPATSASRAGASNQISRISLRTDTTSSAEASSSQHSPSHASGARGLEHKASRKRKRRSQPKKASSG